MISLKIHQSYRNVVAICDVDLIGKRFEEGKRELHVRESFFKDQELSSESIIPLIKAQMREDSTFNIVGPKALKAAQEAGLVDKDGADHIQGIPFVLILL